MTKLILMILSLMVTSVQAKEANSPSVTPNITAINKQTGNLSPKESATLFNDKKAVIIDVREDDEWQEKHIPGALHIPLAQLNNRLGELEQYKHTPIITQCQKGGRSKQAQAVLKAAGFNDVYNLEGGLVAWDKAGLKTQ
ncbi:MAG: rhodanese-like domain-containing protein [Methylococcaceae bacterium]|nr:rhodanese-like domain-containing protein [Methylococcaceae bacterium]